MKTTCKKSWPVNLNLTTFHGFCILLTTEVVFPNLNVVAHVVIPAGWGSCSPRLAIFTFSCCAWNGSLTHVVLDRSAMCDLCGKL